MRRIPTHEPGELAAEQRPQPIPPPVACSWWLADRATTVELCWNPRHAQRTFRSDSGLGLLLGASTTELPRKIQIHRAVQAAGIKREGTALDLLGADTKALANSLTRNAEGSGERVLGYFRTVSDGPAGSLYPVQEDERAIQECCGVAPGLVLLLRWDGDRPRGAFYLWDEAGLEQNSSMPLSFSTAAPAANASSSGAAAAVITALETPAPVPVAEPKPAAASINRKSLITGILCGLVLALTAMAAIALWWQARREGLNPFGEPRPVARAPAGGDNSASLKVETHGGMLEIRWNPSSWVIQSSDNGYLSILDGEELKTIPLTGNELRTGLMLYSPKHAQLTVSLVGVKGGRTVTESVTSIGRQAARVAPARLPARPLALSQPPASSAAADEVRQPGSSPIAGLRSGVEPPQLTREAPVAPPPVRAAARTQLQPSQPAKPAGTVPEPAPRVSPAPVPLQTALSVPRELSVSPQAPPTIEQPTTPAPSGVNFTPARLRSRVAMPPADDLRHLLARELKVPVTVQIDASGNVTKAAADMPPTVAGALASMAVKAAKRYSFDPARRDGVPVPSELVLMFHFDKK